ncbi:MAG: hypothetical protein KBB11_03055 [Bacteroidales bacterium]|nr:hypothetical protein [Bacteroidales bacterium]
MKKVCTLLTSSILKDFSVIKTIQVLSRYCEVDLFYLRPSDSDKELFNDNTRLFALKQRTGKKELFLGSFGFIKKCMCFFLK